MKYNQKKKKENVEIFLFIMVMAVFACCSGSYVTGRKDAAGEPDQEDIFWLVLL